MRKVLRKLLEVVLAVVAVVSLTMFGKNLYDYYSLKGKEDDLTQDVALVSEKSWRDAWKELKSRNGDFQCWLEWDSGLVKTAVMQPSADNPNYYMNHDFDNNWNELGGSAFFSPGFSRENQNLVIYGHSVFYYGSYAMDLMFSPLLNLRDQATFEQNKTFWLHWEDKDEQYEIAYVCDLDITETSWDYEQCDFADDENFNNWVSEAKKFNVASTNIELARDDTLVTFQTCTSLGGTGRLVIIAKKIAEMS